jgi:hypothetical protein
MRQLEGIIDAIPPSVLATINTGSYADDGAAAPLPAVGPDHPARNPSGRLISRTPSSGPMRTHGPRARFARVRRDTADDAPGSGDVLDELIRSAQRLSMAPPSMFFLDAQGHTRWHGETSGLPLLDFLVDSHAFRPPYNPHPTSREAVDEVESGSNPPSADGGSGGAPSMDGDSPTAVHSEHPSETSSDGASEAILKRVTDVIPAELMDECVIWCGCMRASNSSARRLVHGFLSTSYYLLPFLHLPTFIEVRTPIGRFRSCSPPLRTTQIPESGLTAASRHSWSPSAASPRSTSTSRTCARAGPG